MGGGGGGREERERGRDWMRGKKILNKKKKKEMRVNGEGKRGVDKVNSKKE